MIKLSTLSSIWRCCYDKISGTVKGFDSELVKEEISRRTEFDGVRTPLKIDISTGDVITPKEMQYNFKLMLEDRSIEVWAYNLETVMAEKLETLLHE